MTNAFEGLPARAKSRWPLWLGLWFVGLVVAAALDMPIVRHVVPRTHNFTKNDFGLFLRNGGYLATWIVVGLAIALNDARTFHYRPFESWYRGATLITASVVGGLAAECVKAICRRERLDGGDDWYHYRSMGDKLFDTGGLSLPSSHTMVAFAAAFVLARMFPGARWVFFALAAGTAVTRVAGGAHYLSDVYVAMGLAWVVAQLTVFFFEAWAVRRGSTVIVAAGEGFQRAVPAR